METGEEVKRLMKADPDTLIAGLAELEFRHKLRAFRIMFGISLDEMSRRLGVTKQFLSTIERGEHRTTMKVLGRMKEAFGADLNVLYESVQTRPKD